MYFQRGKTMIGKKIVAIRKMTQQEAKESQWFQGEKK